MDKDDVKNNVDKEFSEIEESENKKYIKIVIVLYCIVVVLVVVLVLGLKMQKKVIEDNHFDEERVSEIGHLNNNFDNRGIMYE